jgi:ribonuclease HII
MRCTLKHENALRKAGVLRVAGIDEAGRGPLAGPVVAAAVMLPEGFRHARVDDSKKLTAEVREEIYAALTGRADVCWAVAIVEHEEIDRINILRASHEAMRRAVVALAGLGAAVEHALIDGRPVRPFPVAHTAIVKGDGLSKSIAAASILAKVTRDRIMIRMDIEYPAYGFAQHKGYATEVHLAALKVHGPCPIHRKTFLPVAQGLLDFAA